LIPGNHDSLFSTHGDLRETLLETLKTRFDELDLAGESSSAILKVQDNSFDFLASARGEELLGVPERLHYSYTYEFDGGSVSFQCFNSAWLSRKHEEPAKLFFPRVAFPDDCNDTCSDVVVSLIHHPSNWLDPVNARAFWQSLRRNSDFILSGHEHVSSSYTRQSEGEEVVRLLEAGALQDPHSGRVSSRYFI
jgi:hypothetical protein